MIQGYYEVLVIKPGLDMELESLVTRLYGEQPTKPLFHYTSLACLHDIVKDRCFWAGDIRYLNDSAELRYTADFIRREISQRLSKDIGDGKVLNQLKEWINHRLTDGHIIFAISFTENGNLLSQWRAYCAPGKGVSIGLNPDYLKMCANRQSFKVGKCIYDVKKQQECISSIIKYVEFLAKQKGEALPSEKHPTQSFHHVFELCEDYLLQIAALIKHPSFEEEHEWRLVSPIIKHYVKAQIFYREGISFLLPYIKFSIAGEDGSSLKIEKVYLGPTQHINLSMKSLDMYLSKVGASPKNGICYCQIPYREK